MQQAKYFLGIQVLIALIMMTLIMNRPCILWTLFVLPFVVAYPYTKRLTYWPALILAVPRNIGAVIGWTALHGQTHWTVCLPVFTAGLFWTLVYDTIYGHQDKLDDGRIGIKSCALRMGGRCKLWLLSFSVGMVVLLVITGVMSLQTWPYYVSVIAVAFHLAWQIYSVDLDDPKICGRTYQSNVTLGQLFFGGITASNLLKLHSLQSVFL